MRRTTVLAVAATLAASLVVTACGSSDKPAAKKQAPAVGTSQVNAQPRSALKQGGSLRIAIQQWITQYNSNTADGAQGDAASITQQVEPTLFLADAQGVEHPDPDYLLSAKVTSTSPQKVTYTLNPKAHWSDGTALSWHDFAAQWKALNGTDSAYEAADTSGYDQISGVARGANDQQAVVTFSGTYADWQRLFNPLFPASQYSTPAEFNTAWVNHVPVTAGSFKIGSYDKTDQTITLVPDPKWWGDKPLLDKVIYRALDADTYTQAFLNKEIDEAPAGLPEDYHQLVKDKDAVIETGSRWDEVHITLNGGHGPLKDVRVRQALSMAVNRRALTDAFGNGIPYRINELGNHFFMPNQKGYKDNSGAYGTFDPKQAAKLLDAAGWKDNGAGKPRTKDGTPLTLSYVLSNGSNQAQVDQAQLVQQMLGQVGIKMAIQKVPANDYFNKYVDLGNFDLTSFRNVDDRFPSEMHATFQQPKGKNLFQNFGSVGSPQVDQLLNEAQSTTDPARAIDLYNQADAQIWKLGHSVELYQRPEIDAVRKGLANFGASGLADTDWTKVGWQK